MSAEVMPFMMPEDLPAVPTDDDPALPLAGSERNLAVQELLGVTLEMEASDLHITSGAPPVVRVHGDLKRLENYPTLNPEGLRRMVFAILTQKQREKFEQDLELDTSYTLPGRARFRLNVYYQRESVGASRQHKPMAPRRERPAPAAEWLTPVELGLADE